jgi:hypothetical protein
LGDLPTHLLRRDFRVRVFGVVQVKHLHILLRLIRKDRLNDAALDDDYDHGSILPFQHHRQDRLAVVAGADVSPELRIMFASSHWKCRRFRS